MDTEDESRNPAAVSTFDVDRTRRLVSIRIRRNMAPEEMVPFYARIFESPGYEPGFALVVDRRGLSDPPSAEAVRAVVQYLRQHADQTGACRMAIVTDADAPRAAWRAAEMLAGHYTSVELRVFEDLDGAEMWATRGSSSHG